MKQISRSSMFYRRTLPVILLAAVLIISIFVTGDIVRGRSSVSGLIVLWAFVAFGYCLAWLHTSGLADEVWDAGDHLLVKVGGRVERVPIADVESVSEAVLVNPRRITLRLARSSPFGRTIVFWPAMDVLLPIPFVKSRITEDLTARVQHAQRMKP